MKFELIRFLVREQGCRVLALRRRHRLSTWSMTKLLGNSADWDAAIAALTYPSWKTEEMWRVVEWLRRYNQTAKHPVQFRGFDVQDPWLSLSVAEALASAAKDSAVTASLASLRLAMKADPTGKAAITEVGLLLDQMKSSTIISAYLEAAAAAISAHIGPGPQSRQAGVGRQKPRCLHGRSGHRDAGRVAPIKSWFSGPTTRM